MPDYNKIKNLIKKFISDINDNGQIGKIYNEFSLQHELGSYLKNNGYNVCFEKNVIPYLIKDYHKKVNKQKVLDAKKKFCKKEIDIAIEDNDGHLKCAIELKLLSDGAENFPSFLKDIAFMEQVKTYVATTETTFCLNFACNRASFCNVKHTNEIGKRYKFFRSNEDKKHAEDSAPLIAEWEISSQKLESLLIEGGKDGDVSPKISVKGYTHKWRTKNNYKIEWMKINNTNGKIKNYLPDPEDDEKPILVRYYLLECGVGVQED